jgi:hypothetical protein
MQNKQGNLREEHNRKIQQEIDFERNEIKILKENKDSLIPKIMEYENKLRDIDFDVKRIDINIDCREGRIKVLTEQFWKSNE